MGDGTSIEWTDATVNVVNGCSVMSPGCANCFAMRAGGRNLPGHPSTGLTKPSKAGHVWTGEVRFNERALLQPLNWTRPRTIFWNAHGDLFHDSVADEWIFLCLAVMTLTPHHKHQLLTKRSPRMRNFMNAFEDRPDEFGAALAYVTRLAGLERQAGIDAIAAMVWPLPNVWLGVSVEDQQRADERIPDLLETPAAVRYLSCEPLLEQVDLTKVQAPRYVAEDHELDWKFSALEMGDYYQFEDSLGFWECGDGPRRDARLDWVIVGGESGPGARKMQPAWARSLRDQCANAGVPFLFKQWGAWSPLPSAIPADTLYLATKKIAGRLLDGVQHDGMPA